MAVSRPTHRCIDWHELKSYESEQRKRFSPNRYRGYGHFLQDFIGVTPTHTAGPMGKARAFMISDDDAAWDGEKQKLAGMSR